MLLVERYFILYLFFNWKSEVTDFQLKDTDIGEQHLDSMETSLRFKRYNGLYTHLSPHSLRVSRSRWHETRPARNNFFQTPFHNLWCESNQLLQHFFSPRSHGNGTRSRVTSKHIVGRTYNNRYAYLYISLPRLVRTHWKLVSDRLIRSWSHLPEGRYAYVMKFFFKYWDVKKEKQIHRKQIFLKKKNDVTI